MEMSEKFSPFCKKTSANAYYIALKRTKLLEEKKNLSFRNIIPLYYALR